MKTGTFIAMIFLILVGIAHILRVIMQVEVVTGSYHIPIWMSWAAVVLTFALSAAIWNEHRNRNEIKDPEM